jgi:hypothetical protein
MRLPAGAGDAPGAASGRAACMTYAACMMQSRGHSRAVHYYLFNGCDFLQVVVMLAVLPLVCVCASRHAPCMQVFTAPGHSTAGYYCLLL